MKTLDDGRSERFLGGGYAARTAGIQLDRLSKCAAKSLEDRFALVMRVIAAQIVDVNGDLGVIDEALKEFVSQIDVETADHRATEIDLPDQTRPAREIDHDP